MKIIYFVERNNDYVYYLCKEYYAQSFVDSQAIAAEGKAAGVDNPYMEEPYKSRIAEVFRKRYSGTAYLWRCDLDGSNKEMLLALPGAGALKFYIWNGYLYTSYNFFDPETGDPLGEEENERGQPCRIDLETGELEFMHTMGN